MGIAGMVLGIVALVVSFIPCLGWYAIFLSVPGLVLSGIAMKPVKLPDGSKAKPNPFAIAGLALGIIASGLAIYQYTLAKETVKKLDEVSKDMKEADKEFKKDMKKLADQSKKDFEKSMKEAEKAARDIEKKMNSLDD